jgi:hypothetical protein
MTATALQKPLKAETTYQQRQSQCSVDIKPEKSVVRTISPFLPFPRGRRVSQGWGACCWWKKGGKAHRDFLPSRLQMPISSCSSSAQFQPQPTRTYPAETDLAVSKPSLSRASSFCRLFNPFSNARSHHPSSKVHHHHCRFGSAVVFVLSF